MSPVGAEEKMTISNDTRDIIVGIMFTLSYCLGIC